MFVYLVHTDFHHFFVSHFSVPSGAIIDTRTSVSVVRRSYNVAKILYYALLKRNINLCVPHRDSRAFRLCLRLFQSPDVSFYYEGTAFLKGGSFQEGQYFLERPGGGGNLIPASSERLANERDITFATFFVPSSLLGKSVFQNEVGVKFSGRGIVPPGAPINIFDMRCASAFKQTTCESVVVSTSQRFTRSSRKSSIFYGRGSGGFSCIERRANRKALVCVPLGAFSSAHVNAVFIMNGVAVLVRSPSDSGKLPVIFRSDEISVQKLSTCSVDYFLIAKSERQEELLRVRRWLINAAEGASP